jgi:hypothetical protein
MAKYTFDHDPWSWSGQRPDSVDDVPRWLVLAGIAGGVGLALLLVRYAIDLLGLVFIIVLVGFSIRTLTDWLSDSDTVSAGSLAWVFVGLFGTALVALWIFGSPAARAARLESHVPQFVQTSIQWAEDRGWGQRVLLPQPAGERGERGRAASVTGRLLPPVDGRPLGSQRSSPGPVALPPADAAAPAPSAKPVETDRTAASLASASRATVTSLTAAPARARAGAAVRLRAVVRCDDDSRSAEGLVVFWRGSMVLGSAPLRREGSADVAHLMTADLPPGAHELSAEYIGTPRCRTSRSPAIDQVVVEP